MIYLAVRQEITPNQMLGRVSGSIATLVQMTMPLGIIAGGLWAEFLNIRVLFVINIVLSAVILIGYFAQLLTKPLNDGFCIRNLQNK